MRQDGQKVGGEHTGVPELSGDHISGFTVNERPRSGGFKEGQPLRQQSGDNTGQYITVPAVANPGLATGQTMTLPSAPAITV